MPHDMSHLLTDDAKLTDPRVLRDQVTCGRAPKRTGSMNRPLLPFRQGSSVSDCTRPPDHARTSGYEDPRKAGHSIPSPVSFGRKRPEWAATDDVSAADWAPDETGTRGCGLSERAVIARTPEAQAATDAAGYADANKLRTYGNLRVQADCEMPLRYVDHDTKRV